MHQFAVLERHVVVAGELRPIDAGRQQAKVVAGLGGEVGEIAAGVAGLFRGRGGRVVVVRAAVTAGQLAGRHVGGSWFVAHDRGVAGGEPPFDVLGASHQASGDQLELMGLGTEVVAVGGDLAGRGALEPAEVVGAGRQMISIAGR
jgi:hypothetical protein